MANLRRNPFTRSDAAVMACSIAIAGGLIAGHWHYTLDDTYIYLQFARNMLAGNGMSFNPGEQVYGFTSPLWLGLITACGWCGMDLLFSAKLLGALSTAASIVVFHMAARRWIESHPVAVMATILWSANAWLLRWSVCGIEAPLAVMLVMAALHVYAVERVEGRFGFAPIVAGLAGLARPEALLLVPLFLAEALSRSPRKSAAATAKFALVAAAVVLPWFVLAWISFHSVVPTTFAAKSDPHHSLSDALFAGMRIGSIIGATSGVEVLALLALLVPAVRRRVAALPPAWMAWIFALPLVYVLGNTVIVSRYVMIVLPSVIVLGWLVLSSVLAGNGIARRGMAALFLVVLVQNQYVLWRVVKPQATAFSATVDTALIPMGRWLRANSPRDALVAVPDIGAVGYFSDRRILDLNRIITPQLNDVARNVSYDDVVLRTLYTSVGVPDFLIDRDALRARLSGRHGSVVLDSISTWTAPSLGIATVPGGVVYTLYRVSRVP